MSAVERIHKAEDQVATMQSYLVDAQQILGVAEEVAMAGSKAKRCSRRLILVPIALLGVAAVLIIWRRSKRSGSQSDTAAQEQGPT